ncbi:FlaA locus 229 kDa protein [endosymbiont of Acanthamoeba sp. UWC8]|uniref:MotE family protein n=1 Tax=endosymbiont of Acanthamoeba sp. UWC8 TaxID=86106 RepID=UPI0004D1B097|nr:hypothetical protein [endosymbiont of Acanthamoeba sp. UWC8]AIF81892.1 FlaA locus 229 kDa protein [endosymbiont of Acanthamoeba sp. UWC8]
MLRLLPFLIGFLFILVFSKVMNVSEHIPEIFSASELNAQDTSNKEPVAPKDVSTSSPTLNAEDTKQYPTNPAELSSEGDSDNKSGWQNQFSSTEVEVLGSLVKRREELDVREKDISLKENVLKVTEKRIQQKIDALQNLITQAQLILDKYNEKRNQEILTLVKIYENMKPKDAARIFDELEMPILVEVSSQMKEAKLAAILGLMSSDRAKDLTIELANRRKIDLSNFN